MSFLSLADNAKTQNTKSSAMAEGPRDALVSREKLANDE